MEAREPARVAVCSSEALSETPAGPALRAAGLARGLAAHGLEVVLVAPAGSRPPDGCALASFDELPQIVASGATVVASGFLLERNAALADAAHLVVDAAGPFLLENLVVHERQSPARRRRTLVDEAAVAARLLASADLILCAHPRQRDLTFGMLLALGALRPELLDGDRGIDDLIEIVPFGPTGPVDARTWTPDHDTLRLVWPGGLWDWLDPVTLLEGVAEASASGASISLELWGSRSPDPLVPASRAAEAVTRRADELGIADRLELVAWVPHAERRARLASADLAVTLDPGGVEARYAFRTRLVDALAVGLPVLATAGEYVADEAERQGAGFTVSPRDAHGLARLLSSLASDPARLAAARTRAPGIAAGWSYEHTIAPLAAWCRAPRRARAGAPDDPRRNALTRRLARVRRG